MANIYSSNLLLVRQISCHFFILLTLICESAHILNVCYERDQVEAIPLLKTTIFSPSVPFSPNLAAFAEVRTLGMSADSYDEL